MLNNILAKKIRLFFSEFKNQYKLSAAHKICCISADDLRGSLEVRKQNSYNGITVVLCMLFSHVKDRCLRVRFLENNIYIFYQNH